MRRRLLSAGGGVVGPSLLCCGALLTLPSCVHVKTDPIKVEPIHITMDINVKVERQLDDFFAFEKQYDQSAATAPATIPTTAPAGEQ
jgi:hypothetical protein